MSKSLSINLRAPKHRLGIVKESEDPYRLLSKRDVMRVLSNLGFKLGDYIPIENPRIHGFNDIEDLIYRSVINVPISARIDIKEISKVDLIMVTFYF